MKTAMEITTKLNGTIYSFAKYDIIDTVNATGSQKVICLIRGGLFIKRAYV